MGPDLKHGRRALSLVRIWPSVLLPWRTPANSRGRSRPRAGDSPSAASHVILAAGLAIATAALVVVGLTAMRVTGDGYAPSGQIQLLR